MDDLATRIRQLEDRVALSELRSKYCWYTVRGLKDEVRALFTEDGVFENHRGNAGAPAIAAGQAALAAYFQRMAPARRIPVVFNEVFQIDGDHATGTCVMQSVGDSPFCGHYVDQFERGPEGWKFARRSFYPYWPDYAPSAERHAP